MIFGNRNSFAIEIGEIGKFSRHKDVFAQFRFWVGGEPVGDWDDRIPLLASIRYMREFCNNSIYRSDVSCKTLPAKEVIGKLYDAFFEHDYSAQTMIVPNLRDRHHLDDVGMGAIIDKFGIIVVTTGRSTERIIATDIVNSDVIADVALPVGTVDSVGVRYIEWAEHAIGSPEGGISMDE